MRRARKTLRLMAPALLLALALCLPARAEGPGGQAPSPAEKCPVCGMFVHKYPDWLSQAVLGDGTVLWFDGPKDMFKYFLEPERYSASAKKPSPVSALYVTEYYGLSRMDARAAYYVMGSSVMGPMGRELVPLVDEASALEFMADHAGKRILRFGDVTLGVLGELDR